MAEKDKQADDYKINRRPDILRAKDIIPGNAGKERDSGVERAGQVDIPQFDLANDIMAEHRRLSAIRRKGPSTVVPRPSSFVSRRTMDEGRETSPAEWDPIIADIVARDIDRLCSGTSWR